MADAEKARRAAAGRERLVRKIAGAESAARRADAAAKDAGVRIDPPPTPAPLPEGRDAADYHAAAKDAEKAHAAAEANVRMALSNPKVIEPATGVEPPPGGFESLAHAQRYSNNNVYAMKTAKSSVRNNNAIIVKSHDGTLHVYVKREYKSYGKRAQDMHGGKYSEEGLVAEHVMSKVVAEKTNTEYVLIGKLNERTGASHSPAESGWGELNRRFGKAVGDGVEPINRRSLAKINGVGYGDYRSAGLNVSYSHDTEAVRTALFESEEDQKRIRNLMGPRITQDECQLSTRERFNAAVGKRTKAPDRGRDHGKG